MNYSILADNQSGKFNVFETKTENVLIQKNAYEEARKACQSLNFGCGFDGFTPDFFTKRLIIK